MATNEPITDPQAAVKMVRAEHHKLAELVMHLTDLIGDFQAGREDLRRVRVDRMRQADGHMLRKSAIELEAAITALAPDHDVHELLFAEFLLETITEADEPRDDDIIELCERRMPACIAEAA